MVAVALFVGFVVGALVVVVVEVVAVLFLIWKLGEKEEVRVVNSLKDDDQLQFPFPNKQGWIWILEKEKIPKTSQSTDKTLRQQKRKIEAFDVTPVKKHATIKDKSLMITEPDGTLTKVYLSGCIVEAVSAANLASRKWAKKYPVKVENKSSDIYHGSKLFYLYFETSCEKESWCKVLRLASCEDKEKLIWFYKSRAEFHNYLASLNVEYPSFLKPSTGVEEKIIQAMIPKSVPSGSRNLGSQNSDTDSNDKMCRDDGTLCCNLLISRLFFDAKSSVDLRNLMQAHIQRMLSIARTPSFVGEIICTDVNPGVIPPYIHGMRVVPSDLKEVVAMELDIEYYGGAVLDIETRIEMQELENSDSKSVDDVTTDLLEGFEHYEEQIKLNEQTNQAVELKDDERHKLEETKSFKGNEQTASTSTLPKWKSVINSVAKQVSQVPLSLAIRVTTLRGTLKVYIKPPPSDQIWFGFTSMPDIDFSLESAVGDHKITSGHIALFIINKFKGAIRETMVLPNCESATVHFMLAEKNDWIPQQSAPFIWANPELNPEPPTEPTISHEVPCPQPPDEIHPQDVSSTTETTHNQTSSDDDEKPTENDEKTPLLESTEQNAAVVEENVGFPSSQPPSPPQAAVAEENKETADENKLKRSGTRAKMLGFRKKMGEKLEEKRRNIEEKGRHMVEKMRGPG
ncbi:putative synaptotagmin-like mitochondrial-lipid-binding domain-containing protein [Helianthus annuus]|nr:putative synaptotagmin-like mitochondrial-lipid-binding domain-containing protein [Helianthus annuus]